MNLCAARVGKNTRECNHSVTNWASLRLRTRVRADRYRVCHRLVRMVTFAMDGDGSLIWTCCGAR